LIGNLLNGEVWHRRQVVPANEFTYPVQYVELDLEEIRKGRSQSWLFSCNRPNLYSLNDRDHYGHDQGGFADAIPRLVAHSAPSVDVKRITLITQPSFLGYVFNPVSFYVVDDGAVQPALVLAEVHNRVNRRHVYVLSRSDKSGAEFTSRFEKDFYVSPFQKPDGEYRFSMTKGSDQLSFSLDLYEDDHLALSTRLDLRSEPLNDPALLRAMTTHPFSSQKTLGGIYWQALKLKLKGALYRRPSGRLGRWHG